MSGGKHGSRTLGNREHVLLHQHLGHYRSIMSWMEEREEEEDRLTSAIKTCMLLPTELIQLTTFMLNNSNVMEECDD
jgi:hypothetical protein